MEAMVMLNGRLAAQHYAHAHAHAYTSDCATKLKTEAIMHETWILAKLDRVF